MDDVDDVEALRARIAAVDARLLALVAERVRLAREVGAAKAALGRGAVDGAQEAVVLERAGAQAAALGLDPALARAAFEVLIRLARAAQGSSDAGQ